MNEEGFDEEKARFHLGLEAEELKLKMNRTFCHTHTYPPLLSKKEREKEFVIIF